MFSLSLAQAGNQWSDSRVRLSNTKNTQSASTGRPEFPEEAYIKKLDGSTGASLKLTILNHHGRVWTMVAGGGASVVYADTISDYGFGKVR